MKTEKQSTAVQWFVQQLRNGKELNDNLIQQAKEMEKEQILAAHSDWSRITENLPTRSAVQYYYETFNQNKMETQSIKQEQKEMTFQIEAQLLINRFYELETDGKKMDYDTAVDCAKITAETIIKSGQLHLSEDRLYWNCILKHCDLLHSQEYLLARLEREEKSYNTDLKESSSFAVPADKVISIGSDEEKCQSNPKKNNWYLCRLKEGDIKLCFWNGTHWENYTKKEHDSFPRVVKWFEIEDLKKLIFLL